MSAPIASKSSSLAVAVLKLVCFTRQLEPSPKLSLQNLVQRHSSLSSKQELSLRRSLLPMHSYASSMQPGCVTRELARLLCPIGASFLATDSSSRSIRRRLTCRPIIWPQTKRAQLSMSWTLSWPLTCIRLVLFLSSGSSLHAKNRTHIKAVIFMRSQAHKSFPMPRTQSASNVRRESRSAAITSCLFAKISNHSQFTSLTAHISCHVCYSWQGLREMMHAWWLLMKKWALFSSQRHTLGKQARNSHLLSLIRSHYLNKRV